MARDPLIDLGRRIADLRREQGYSQEDFAIEAGFGRSYMGDIERGERNVAFRNLVRIAHTLDLAPSELLEGIAPPGKRRRSQT